MAARNPSSPSSRARAFTLMEVLVVVGIIGVLVAITLVVGKQVVAGGKQRITQDTLRVLDSALQAMIAANKNENPDPRVVIKNAANQNIYIPAADARDMDNTYTPITPGLPGHQMINSVGLFYQQAMQVPAARTILEKLPSKFVHAYDPDDAAGGQPSLMTVFDAWDQPIRYVHPAFQGTIVGAAGAPSPGDVADRPIAPMFAPLATGDSYLFDKIRRNYKFTGTGATAQDTADSDGGSCEGNRPYFYSAGPDKLVGIKTVNNVNTDYNADNVYTTRPKPPAK